MQLGNFCYAKEKWNLKFLDCSDANDSKIINHISLCVHHDGN